MAETAAVGTAAHYFDRSVVLGRLEGRDSEVSEFRFLVIRSEREVNRLSGRFLSRIPEARNLTQGLQALLACPVCAQDVYDAVQISLRFANVYEIEEFGERKRIGRSRSSREDYRVVVRPVLCTDGDSSEIEDLEDVGGTELVAYGDSKIIHLLQRKMFFQREKRNPLLPQKLLEIRGYGEYAVADCVVVAVHYVVQDPDGIVRHSYLIEIGKAHAASDVAFLIPLLSVYVLASYVAGGILYFGESVSEKFLEIQDASRFVISCHCSLSLSSLSSGLSLSACDQ